VRTTAATSAAVWSSLVLLALCVFWAVVQG
jgi:hypothetical protein